MGGEKNDYDRRSEKRDGAPPFFTGQTAIFQGFQQKVFETVLLFLITVIFQCAVERKLYSCLNSQSVLKTSSLAYSVKTSLSFIQIKTIKHLTNYLAFPC